MNIMRFIERLVPERRGTDAIAKQLHREFQHVGDGLTAHQIVEGCTAAAQAPTLDECRAMVDVLSRLPQRQRAVLEMRMKGMEIDEIAAKLGLTLEIAKNEWGRAMYFMTKEMPRD